MVPFRSHFRRGLFFFESHKQNQKRIEKAIMNVTAKIRSKADKKIKSAIFSYFGSSRSFEVRIERNENRQLPMSRIQAKPVNSSMRDTSLIFDIFSEVSTIRQKPSRFDEVYKMCSDLLFAIFPKCWSPQI